MKPLLIFLLLTFCRVHSLPYHYGKNRYRLTRSTSTSRLSPSISFGLSEAALSKYRNDRQDDVHKKETGRMLGINTGNPEADSEAGMWLMALIGTLAAAVPVAFLSPGLGFKKRSLDDKSEEIVQQLQENLFEAIKKFRGHDNINSGDDDL